MPSGTTFSDGQYLFRDGDQVPVPFAETLAPRFADELSPLLEGLNQDG